ncbi:hypothetical protein MRB53_037807 [Persea americana]|nr:hypothetical protein MRB53_037807 [Persea americana]
MRSGRSVGLRTAHVRQLKLTSTVLKTGLTPSASGSAYFELDPGPSSSPPSASTIPSRSSLKLTCTVHGPKPLPRSAPFSPQLILSTNVKYAPFAARQRRGFIRDAREKDLSAHLESALRGVIIADRWPKSGVDVVVTVLEAEEDGWWADEFDLGQSTRRTNFGEWGMMTVLAGCITAASAALVEAGIDCVDLVSGGVAGLVRSKSGTSVVLDPCPSEHEDLVAGCVVGHLASRDELVEIWSRGDNEDQAITLVDHAVDAAIAARGVLASVVKETTALRFGVASTDSEDTAMT